MKTKTTPTVTRLLQKVNEIFVAITSIKAMIDHKNKAAFSVTFVHRQDRTLIRTNWSDQYTGSQDHNDDFYEYTYEITSKGIHFTGYSEHKIGGQWWETERCWYSNGDESRMKLIEVPNIPPPNYKGTMYTFHQEKIREALSALPAWAIVCRVY